MREDGKGHCEHCRAVFAYQIVHNGFNDSTHAYCDRCGLTTMLTALGVNPAQGYFQHEPPCVRWFVSRRVRAIADAKLVASRAQSRRGDTTTVAAGWSLAFLCTRASSPSTVSSAN